MQSFDLKIKYKFNKRNIILDALSRLVNIYENFISLSLNYIKFNTFYINVYIYITTLIEISEDFKKYIIKKY